VTANLDLLCRVSVVYLSGWKRKPFVKGMYSMRRAIFLLVLILGLSLVACGGESAPSSGEGPAAAGNAAAGETVFSQTAAPACTSCHSLEPGTTLAGPSLAMIGAEADSRVAGQSAEDYVRESIVNPNAHIVDGFAANLMPATYGSQLTEQQITDLVAYLLTLK
jgi:mono/diheme cytochrome c family protein